MKLSDEKKMGLTARIAAGLMRDFNVDARLLEMLTGMEPIMNERDREDVQKISKAIGNLTRVALYIVEKAERAVEEKSGE